MACMHDHDDHSCEDHDWSLYKHIDIPKNRKLILKNVYILISSYLSYGVNQGKYWSGLTKAGLYPELEDATVLSSFLLNQLHRKLTLTINEAVLDQNMGFALLLDDNSIWGSPEEILLLLRCCCLVACLHPHDQTLKLKSQDVVALLRTLYSHLLCSQSNKSTNSTIHVVKRMLEVYVDEVFADRPFQDCLAIAETISCTRQNQSICSSLQIKSVLEVMAAHFLSSVSGDYSLQTLLESLMWRKNVQSYPELSLTVGLSLITHPVVMSGPVIFQSHIISLVSEVIGTYSFPHKAFAKASRLKIYLSTFYDATNLYRLQFSELMTSSCDRLYTSGKTAHRAFQSLFQCDIFDQVNLVLADLNHAWRAQINETPFILTSDAISYIKMNIHIIGETHRDNVFTFMNSVVTNIICVEIDEILLERVRAMTLEDMCLFAATIKLMSCSLLQATTYSDDEISKHKILGNSPLSGIMSCFAEYSLLPMKVQQLLLGGLKSSLSSCDEFRLMFVHFAGLLSLSMASGLDILVKGCLFFMLGLINTLMSEEGGSEFMRFSGYESSAHEISQANSPSTPTEMTPSDTSHDTHKKISSLRMALKFQKARHLILRRQTSVECSDISDMETCNGEAFMKCFAVDSKDIAELADFIECEPEKDYSSWLVNRQKYRYKKLRKLAKQRRNKMMKVCRSSGSQGRVKL